MAGDKDIDIPETGAIFTFGRSRFAENIPSHFYIRNDPIVEVGCGDEHTIVVCQKGRVFVFGNNDYGQLGLGHKNVTVKPGCVKSLKPEKVVLIACGRAHTLVCTSTSKIFSWGNNSDGQLGVGDIADRSAPTRVVGIKDNIIQLSAGCVSSAALTEKGQLYVWGSNSDGQLGLLDTNDNVLSPVLLPFDQRITQMSCGYYHSAFVTESGALYTFGESESGKLGLPDSLTNITTPQKVTLAVPVKSVFCGGNHTMVLTADGEVFAFGNNFNGQLGLGTELTQNILPTKVIGLEGHIVKEISCGESHTAFITENGNLYTCGEGRHGKLCSEQDNNNQTVPIRVSKFKGYTVKKVACGGCHTMVLAHERSSDESLENSGLSNDTESEDESMIPTLNNRGGTLPPLQRVPIQSPNNNSETTSFFNETQDNHLEELLEQTEVREIEKDMEVKSAITESKTSNSDNSNITSNSNSDRLDDLDDIDADEESSVKSSRPDSKKEPGKKDMRDTSTAMDIIEDDIKSADDKSAGESGSDSDSESGDDDNDNVKVEPVAKKESRVSRFFNTFRLKKPTSAQSAGLEASGERLVIKEKRQRAGSEGRVFRKEHGAGDAEEDRGDSGKSKDSNLGNERRSKTCTIL